MMTKIFFDRILSLRSSKTKVAKEGILWCKKVDKNLEC